MPVCNDRNSERGGYHNDQYCCHKYNGCSPVLLSANIGSCKKVWTSHLYLQVTYCINKANENERHAFLFHSQ